MALEIKVTCVQKHHSLILHPTHTKEL